MALKNGFKMCYSFKKSAIVFMLFFLYSCQDTEKIIKPEWPNVTHETKPWTRWWWHGSAVNTLDLTENLKDLKEASIGGVEITPIYGVKGYENQNINFLSESWVKMLEHVLKESQRLELGVDLSNASSWPFGGPWIEDNSACKNIHIKQYYLNEGEKLNDKIIFFQEPLVRAYKRHIDISKIKFPINSNINLHELSLDQVRFKKSLPLLTLMAYNESGKVLELTENINVNKMLDWVAPKGKWVLYAVFQGWHGKMVERAGPGGEGNVIDHFSKKAIRNYLDKFDEVFYKTDISAVRAFFNDSYEVDDAFGESNWTPSFFEEFYNRRGYNLKEHLPALFGNDTNDKNNRVLCDYRETISDLLLDNFTRTWADWAKSHQSIIRNQAHGSPANILDLYEASDIPETEGTSIMQIKMASSAGHTSGKSLISCEASTWLNEHFLTDLSSVKQNLDRFLSNGVNHIIYHGTPYSPKEEVWPGWLFYAAVHFAPTNSWWSDFKELNSYITNCQSFIQNSTPDNDILLYFPIFDEWSESGTSMLKHFGGQKEKLIKGLSEKLINKGFTFDYISDRQIQKLIVEKNLLKSTNVFYKTILIPKCEYIPLETFEKLISLARSGATIVFNDRFPFDVPGFGDLDKRREKFKNLKLSIQLEKKNDYSVSKIGKGKLIVGNDLEKILKSININKEELAIYNIWFNRIKRPEGVCYFISNWSKNKIDNWITIQSSGKEAIWFNPLNKKIGRAKTKFLNKYESKIYLQIEPGESLILQWFPQSLDIEDYQYWQESDNKSELKGNWEVSFLKGGPTLPDSYQTSELKSWTEKSDELKKFSGTAIYSLNFKKPVIDSPAYKLDLGEVYNSAVIYLNNKKVSTMFGPVYQTIINSDLLKNINKLDIHVSNLMANRIIDMDKNRINYKKFHNINFPARLRENIDNDGLFTSINWQPLKSGLIGPVTLTPLSPMK